jgi:hypothetical protein
MTKRNSTLRGLLAATLLAGALTAAADGYDTSRGFRHPGGLHTQEDFDRVKAQVAGGNETVCQALRVLQSAAYAQPGVQTYPVEYVVRGGSGENYLNAARGAAMAYQNALRWKIEDNSQCADAAVRILMQWARTTRGITGTSDQCLAAGLYGYQFAQAAELMRDYDGWSRDDFDEFCQWMLNVWYRPAINFLRSRNGTWLNSGKWWQAPGHYWSNWGLCNALCVLSVGVLCDDVFIYNQGLSFMKHDQVGSFRDPRTADPILNDGLTEFLGNLVVTTQESELETGAYGRLGQMQESGRDVGHPAMALGLAVDIAHLLWNQGDDFFSYMDHRLAAGIEYVAAQVLSTEGLPWTNYHYGSSGYYYSDSRSWIMTSPVMGVHIRPCWATVIGHYEGVKGVTMPFSRQVAERMGIDGGGSGSTSGGYDQLGYSVLMNTRDVQLCPADQVPTELSGTIELDGTVLSQNELGGLVNTYTVNNTTSAAATGQTAKLHPCLPDGEQDTGLWRWDTGETTRDISVSTDRSRLYRVTYTNSRGVSSSQCFTIAAMGDCRPTRWFTTTVTLDGTVVGDDSAVVPEGSQLTLTVGGTDYSTLRWDDGSTAATRTTAPLDRDTSFVVTVTNQGGCEMQQRISVSVVSAADLSVTDGLIYSLDFEQGVAPATLCGSAQRCQLADGQGYAASTGSSKGYIDLGPTLGTEVMSQLTGDYTLSLDLCVGTPNQLANYCWAWAFTAGNTSQYVAMVNKRGNADWYYEIKDGSASQTYSARGLTTGEWHTLTVVQRQSGSIFYIDGKAVGTATITLLPATFAASLKSNWLGRSPYTADAYMENTLYDNLRIYNRALLPSEVAMLADERPATATVSEVSVGDVNGDGTVNVADVAALVSLLADRPVLMPAEADTDGDGNVSQADLDALVGRIVGRR